VRSIRVLQKIIGDPYYEPTIVVHDIAYMYHIAYSLYNYSYIPAFFSYVKSIELLLIA